jgi:ABC-type multidrug transport system ATPase subunit
MFGERHVSVTLSWRGLTVRSRSDASRVLLAGVSGSLSAGFTALMGPSGAGKTTLLNALALRLDNVVVEGERLINGEPYTRAQMKVVSGYVTQEDILSPLLTAHEALAFTASLKLPADWSAAQRAAQVAAVLAEVGLARAARTLVGGTGHKGLSGGERKRLSVAQELLHRPRLLFLDEPTSGLDSSSATALCALLRDTAASRGVTVLATLHQPSAKIFGMLTGLVLVRAGADVFRGAPGDVGAFLGVRGFPLPPQTNPADWALEVLAEAPDDAFSGKPGAPALESPAASGGLQLAPRRRPAWPRQFGAVAGRCTLEAARGWRKLAVQVCLYFLLGLLYGGYFFQMPLTPTGITDRTNLLFNISLFMGVVSAVGVVFSFPAERLVALKERRAGLYGASAYYAAKTLVDSAAFLLPSIAFIVPLYPMSGLQTAPARVAVFCCFMALCTVASLALALATVAVCSGSAAVAIVALPFAIDFSVLFNGYIAWPAFQSAGWAWLVRAAAADVYISSLRYHYFLSPCPLSACRRLTLPLPACRPAPPRGSVLLFVHELRLRGRRPERARGTGGRLRARGARRRRRLPLGRRLSGDGRPHRRERRRERGLHGRVHGGRAPRGVPGLPLPEALMQFN